MTAGLARTVALLALPARDLVLRLRVEAAANPALLLEAPPAAPGTGAGPGADRSANWLPPAFDPGGVTAPPDSLIAHVLRQIARADLPPPDHAIAIALAEALEPTGWLGEPVAQVARRCGADPARVEQVLARLQRGLDPPGLFARSLAECLHLQLQAEGTMTPAAEALLSHLPLLAEGGPGAVARATGLAEPDLARALGQIRACDPKPGLAFAAPPPPVPPADLLLRRGAEGWSAVVNPHRLSLRVVPGLPGTAAAAALVQAVEGRDRIALAVGQRLARHQSGWLEGAALAGITARDLAGATGFALSTVNRCLTAVTARTPRGTIPLRSLVSAPVGDAGGSRAAMLTRLAELLRGAGATRPSDRELAETLAREGLPVARRTVAKYRARLAGAGS